MADMEVARLKEALYDQYMMMTELHAELDEEREASATAANEALTMILRLEREKAAEKMEASQYKRMTDERMQHLEDNMEELEEEMQEKEMEISFLRHQLREYRQKLSVTGVNVFNEEEERKNHHEEAEQNIMRRNFSLPIFRNIHLQLELENIEMDSLPNSNKKQILNPKLDSPGKEVFDVFEVPKSEASCSKFAAEPKNKCVLSSRESIIAPLEDQSNGVEPKVLNGGDNMKSCSSFTSYMDDLDQIKRCLAKLEKERDEKLENIVLRSEQQFKILEDISERLATIESQIKVAEPPKKYPKQEDVAYASFIEAMLSFSI